MGRGLTGQRHRQGRRRSFMVLLSLRAGKTSTRCRCRKYPWGSAGRGPHEAGSGLSVELRSREMSLHPIADKAEVSVDFPDKAYMGSFGRNSQFDAYADVDSVAIRLVRPGEDRREAMVHLHYGLLAEILAELARSLAARDPLDEQHRNELGEAAKQLAAALQPHEKS